MTPLLEKFVYRCTIVYWRSAIIILGVILVFCKPSIGQGQIFYGAASEAMGRSGRAAVGPMANHFLNPAMTSFTRGYNLGGAFQMRPDGNNPNNLYAVSITDNVPNKRIAAGFGYVYSRTSYAQGETREHDFSLSASGLITQQISIGFLGRRHSLGGDAQANWTKHNVTFGAVYVPIEDLGIAFVAHDMLIDDDLDMLTVFALGVHYVYDRLRLRLDISRQELLNPDHEIDYSLGLEAVGVYDLLLRFGGQWDNVNNKNYLTAGVGWDGPRLKAAYAYRRDLKEGDDSEHTLQAYFNF